MRFDRGRINVEGWEDRGAGTEMWGRSGKPVGNTNQGTHDGLTPMGQEEQVGNRKEM